MYAISPTDIDWFYLLRTAGYNSEINFWTPTPWNVSKMKLGDKLYFMLKSPIRKIGGYGQFLKYENMTVADAWNHFGFKNGCSSKQELVDRLEKYKSNRSSDDRSVLDSEIGCIILNNTVFFEDDQFLDIKDYGVNFPSQVVKIKYFHKVDPFLLKDSKTENEFRLVPRTTEKIKSSRSVTERTGQSKFRAEIALAYFNKCCVTGEMTPELLEAAHIQPYVDESSNHVKNGLLLRVDIHKLFDNGLLFIDEDFGINISPMVKSLYYQSLHGKKISLPSSQDHNPSIEALLTRQFEFRSA